MIWPSIFYKKKRKSQFFQKLVDLIISLRFCSADLFMRHKSVPHSIVKRWKPHPTSFPRRYYVQFYVRENLNKVQFVAGEMICFVSDSVLVVPSGWGRRSRCSWAFRQGGAILNLNGSHFFCKQFAVYQLLIHPCSMGFRYYIKWIPCHNNWCTKLLPSWRKSLSTYQQMAAHQTKLEHCLQKICIFLLHQANM